jgi:dTDP-4-amino-4,6-dideoxygalactose transaminase
MKVPMIDLAWQYEQCREEINKNVQQVLSSGHYVLGPFVKQFQEAVSTYHGTKHSLGVANGSDALMLALQACGVSKGDEVITVPNTFVATAHAIERCGARVKFVDVDPDDHTMVARELEKVITYETKAIIPVHLYGHPCDMDPIMALARDRHLAVIEDCAQAMGAEYKGKKVGSIGDAGCFSFFPTKTLGAAGDGGMVTTNRSDVYWAMESLRRHGFKKKNDAYQLGINSRLDELQAAILVPKFEKLHDWNCKRKLLANVYSDHISVGAPVQKPIERPWASHVYHLYVVQVPKRARLQEFLHERGIQTQVHYESLVTDQPYYSRQSPGIFVGANVANKQILSLPIFPGMTMEQVKYVCKNVCEFYGW